MININRYIKDGITIDGNPEKGYSVFTVPTQRFHVERLEDITPERIELEMRKSRDSWFTQQQLFKLAFDNK